MNQPCPTCEKGVTNGDHFTCRNCTKRCSIDLLRAAEFLTSLDDKRARAGSNFNRNSGGKSAETPLPYDPRVHRLATWARNALTTWTRLILDEHKCRDLPSARDTKRLTRLNDELDAWRKVYKQATTLTDADSATIRVIVISLLDDIAAAKMDADLRNLGDIAAWIADHAEWAGARPWIVDLVNDAGQLREDLEHLFDNPPETMALGRCGAEHGDGTVCDHILAAPLGAKTHTCPRCAAPHDVEQRRRNLIRESDDILVTAKEGARLLRLGGYDVDSHKMYAVVRLVGVKSRLRTKSVTTGRSVDHYGLGSLREALQLCEKDDAMQIALKETRRGARSAGRGEHIAATLTA